MKDNGDQTSTITCPGGTSVTVKNGTSGTNGTNGTNGNNGNNGTNGTSCSVTANPDAGTKTITCTDGTTVTVLDGTNGVDANAVIDFATLTPAEQALTDMNVTVTGITNVAKPVVTFVVREAHGRAVKGIPFSHFSGIAIMQLVPGTPTATGNGVGVDTWVSHMAACATCVASTETATAATLVDQGNGTYVYTVQKDIINGGTFDGGATVAGVAFDANAPHKFGMRLGLSGNPYRPVDAVYEYVPATGANVTGQNDKVSTAACLECHQQWRAGALNAGGVTPFHSGQRYDAQYCVICHNDQRKYKSSAAPSNAINSEPDIDALGNVDAGSGGAAAITYVRGEAVIDLPVWIHKIHMGDKLFLKGNWAGLGADINEIGFPQTQANCAKCHKNATLADNWKTKVSRRACGACHDGIDWVTGNGHGPVNVGGAQANDNLCATCHVGATAVADVVKKHLPVAPIDPNNGLLVVGGNNNTNASALGNPLNPPAGATVLTYSLPAQTITSGAITAGGVTTVAVTGGVNVQVKFRLMNGATPVVFNTFGAGVTELMDGFTGSPSVYCAYALPQDGVAAPADFNASVSGYLKKIWNGTATGSAAGTLAGPDASGYYTVVLTGVTIPATATMLTCGLGYTYGLSTTQPLTQTNVAGYPAAQAPDGGAILGGIAIPPANVWQVAVGFTGRRGATSNASATGTGLIVSPAKCNQCHNMLGVEPTFHAGQRNDGPTCSFCHTQNRTSSGWSAGSESFVHGIHGAAKRTVPFNWHAVSATDGFYKVKYPGKANLCEGCHNPGYYDFSASWYTDARLDTRLAQTVATGTPTAGISLSPYVAAGTNYGSGYSTSNITSGTYNGVACSSGTPCVCSLTAPCEADATTLFNSQITNVCFGCHDADRSVAHFKGNGGKLYAPRTELPTTVEQCLICHGPGKVAAIKTVHYQ